MAVARRRRGGAAGGAGLFESSGLLGIGCGHVHLPFTANSIHGNVQGAKPKPRDPSPAATLSRDTCHVTGVCIHYKRFFIVDIIETPNHWGSPVPPSITSGI